MDTLKDYTLGSLLERSVEQFGSHNAVGFVDGEPIRYDELRKEIARVTHGLEAMGVTPGDRVAIVSENMPNWVVAYFAVTTMGAVVVPVLPDFSVTEVGNILDHSDPKVVFASRRLQSKLGDKNNRPVVVLDDFSGLAAASPDADGRSGGTLGAQAAGPGPAEDDLAAIIYTSGTTGNSKGVMLTHRNLVSNVEASRPIAEFVPGETMVSVLPLSHTYECTIGMLVPISAGACVYYLSKPPSPSVLMPALAKIRPQVMLSVPLFIEKIYRMRVLPKLHGKKILRAALRVPPLRRVLHKAAGKKVMETFGGRLHFFGVGGAALAPDVERFLRDAKFPYAVGYGLTETAPLLAGCGPKNTVFRSTGPALENVELRVAEADPKTGEGELQAKGPNIMRGYYLDQARTDETFTEDGWFRTGDLGIIDKYGRVFIKGRLKNMILGPSGENIYPEELEAVINAKEMVADSIVMRKGGELVALVNVDLEAFKERVGELRSNVSDELEKVRGEIERYLGEVKERVNAEVSSYSRLSKLIPYLEPFEKTPTMKIKRYLYETDETVGLRKGLA
ncbi:MAG: AMP-binding protein [bacterium]